MRISVNQFPTIHLTATLDSIKRFTHQKDILFIALAALSFLVISLFMYRSFRERKISTKQPHSPVQLDNRTEPPSNPVKLVSITLPNGDVWKGESLECSGEGSMRTRFGLHTGHFFKGKLNGIGKIIDNHNVIKEGRFEHGVFMEGKIYPRFPKRSGSKVYLNYSEGVFLNDKLNGKKCIIVQDGVTREGNFIEGIQQGQGKIVFEDKMAWEGIFIDDKFTGKGTVSFHVDPNREKKCEVDPTILQEILLILEFMLHPDKYLTGIDICIGGIKEPLPAIQCTYVHQTVKGFAKLNENLEMFKQLLLEAGLQEIFRAEYIQEFAFHKGNGSTLISNITYTLQIFVQQYLSHKACQTLPNFLMEAFNPEELCFEARSEYLLNYHSTHRPAK